MPKQKKPPRNAYYFFMVERRRELESQGYRFPRGMKDVADQVYQEWKVISPSEKARYEGLAKEAKEADKTNLHNKFTVTGESYAQVMENEARHQAEERALEEMIDCITADTEELDARHFVIMRTINICEVQRPNREVTYFPVELAIASFNLQDGMKKNYWTLIDTVTTPTGYASMVKDMQNETALPTPGSPKFRPEHSDYKRVLRNVRKFIETYVQPYKGIYAVFVMPEDLKAVQGSLDWLVANAWTDGVDEDERHENEKFFDNIRICKLTELLLRLARVAKARDQSYNQIIAAFNHLEDAAGRILNEGCFDYREEITCSFHIQDEESSKMNICCRNMVLRRIYLIIKEIVPHMGITTKEGHDIERFGQRGRPPPYTSGPARVEEQPEAKPKVEVSGPLAGLWGSSSRNSDPTVKDEVSPSYGDTFPPVVSQSSGGNTRQAEEESSFGWGASNTAKYMKISTSNSDNAEPGRIPFGLPVPEDPVANIRISDDTDFPTLGSSGSQQQAVPNFGWGRGKPKVAVPAGRGSGSVPGQSSYDDDFPGASSSQGTKGIGRGRGTNQRYYN